MKARINGPHLAVCLAVACMAACGRDSRAEPPSRAIGVGLVLGDRQDVGTVDQGLSWRFLPYRERWLLVGEESKAEVASAALEPYSEGGVALRRLRIRLSDDGLLQMITAFGVSDNEGIAIVMAGRVLAVVQRPEIQDGEIAIPGLWPHDAEHILASIEARPCLPSASITVRPLLDSEDGGRDGVHIVDPDGAALRFGPGQSFRLKDVHLTANTQDNAPCLAFEVRDSLKASFDDFIEANQSCQIGFFYEDELIAGPVVMRGSLMGRGLLFGGGRTSWTEAEALKWLERLLGSGGATF